MISMIAAGQFLHPAVPFAVFQPLSPPGPSRAHRNACGYSSRDVARCVGQLPLRSKNQGIDEVAEITKNHDSVKDSPDISSPGPEEIVDDAREINPELGHDISEGESYESFLEELVAKCTEATRGPGAMESPHTGSSEWAGFRTTKPLLDVSKMVATC